VLPKVSVRKMPGTCQHQVGGTVTEWMLPTCPEPTESMKCAQGSRASITSKLYTTKKVCSFQHFVLTLYSTLGVEKSVSKTPQFLIVLT